MAMTSDCPHAITCQSEIMLHFVHQSASQSRLLLRLHPLTLTALMGIMLQGTLPVEARTCRTGTPSRLFAAAAVLPHFGIACQGPATPRITRSVRVVTESSPSRHRVVTRTSVSSSSSEAWLQEPTSVGYARPGSAKFRTRSEANAIPSSSRTSLQSPQTRCRHVDFQPARWPSGFHLGFIWVSSGFHLFELSKPSEI